MDGCMYVCMYGWIDACMYACMYAFMRAEVQVQDAVFAPTRARDHVVSNRRHPIIRDTYVTAVRDTSTWTRDHE